MFQFNGQNIEEDLFTQDPSIGNIGNMQTPAPCLYTWPCYWFHRSLSVSLSVGDFYCLPKTNERPAAQERWAREACTEQETLQFIFSFFHKTSLADIVQDHGKSTIGQHWQSKREEVKYNWAASWKCFTYSEHFIGAEGEHMKGSISQEGIKH